MLSGIDFMNTGSNPWEGKCWPFYWVQKEIVGVVVIVAVVGAVAIVD